MRYFFAAILILGSVVWAGPINSEMSGGDFEIYADAFATLDTNPQTGGDFVLYGSSGEFAVSTTASGEYELRSGFEALERAILGFSVTPATISFTDLTPSAVASSTMVLRVSTESTNGYTVTIQEDGNLRDGANEMTDATSGQVITAGTEAYGIVPSGADAAITTTTPITGTATTLASRASAAEGRETSLDFQLAIATTTAIGTYSQTLTFTITVNP